LDKPPADVEIIFRGKKIPHITKTYIAVWNAGNTTLRGEQIVASDSLRISTSSYSSILDASIFSTSREINGFMLSSKEHDSNEIGYQFDFCDPGDGFVVTLFHTGNSEVILKGTIRGMPRGALNLGDLFRTTITRFNQAFAFGCLAITMFVGGYIIFNYYKVNYKIMMWGFEEIVHSPPGGIWGAILLLITAIIGIVFVLGVFLSPVILLWTGVLVVRFVQNSPPGNLALPEEIEILPL
jgi:hypothetical protein